MYKNIFLKLMPSVLKSIMLLFVVIFLSSCMHNVYITSNTFADERSIPCGFRYGSKFFIKAAKKDDQLFSKEVTYKIEDIIRTLGYNVVQDVKQADYCLVFNFEMFSSKKTRDVLRQEPDKVSTKKVYSSDTGNPWDKKLDHEEEIRVRGEFYYVKQDYIVYQKELFIEIYDANLYKETKKQEQLWKAHSYNCDEDNDLRVAVDYLLVSAFRNFGRNTGRSINMSLSDKELRNEKMRLGLM